MRTRIILGIIGSVALSGLALAQGASVTMKPEDVIAARRGGMALTNGSVAAMKAAVDAKEDVKQFTDSAKALAQWGRAYVNLFPDGTQTGGGTHAQPAIWSDRAGFEKAAANFVTAADKLAQLADANDKTGFASQYTVLTQSCGGCHRNYRSR